MERISLNTKEIFCLASDLESPAVYGFRNPYDETASNDVGSEIGKARDSLEEKGVIGSDFDGNYELNEDCAELALGLFAAGQILSFNIVSDGEQIEHSLRFFDDGLLYVKGNGTDYDMIGIDCGDAERVISDIIADFSGDARLPEEKIIIPEPELRKLHRLGKEESAAELKKSGASAGAAELISSALAFEVPFCFVTCTELIGKEPGTECFSFMKNENGIIKMSSFIDNYIETNEFSTVSFDTMKESIVKCLKKLLSDKAGD